MEKRSLGCSCSSSSPPLCLVLPSLLTPMVLSEYLIPLSLSLCHNHCSLWSVCPLCPFKMRHVMRALEGCVSGLFSYSDKISSHIPRSQTPYQYLSAEHSDCLSRSQGHTLYGAGAAQTFRIHVGPFSVYSVHVNLNNLII